MNRFYVKWLGCLVLSFVMSFFLALTPKYKIPSADTKVEGYTKNLSTLKKLSEDINTLAEYSKKGLVFISVTKVMERSQQLDNFFEFFYGQKAPDLKQRKQEGLGSGFVLDEKLGYIVTNNHVIDGADSINVKLANGFKYDAEVVGKDANTDVAVIQIKDKKFNRSGISQLLLENSDDLKVGSIVIALGSPFRLESSVTFGVVSAMGRGSLAIADLGDFIQTDAAINPGNSGGPLLGIDGKVVGMNTAISSRSGGSNGVGFAIPSNLVRYIATNLINEGSISRGYIGVSFHPLRSEWLETLKIPEEIVGVIVREVRKDSPADKAGIIPGDVIFSIGGKKFEKSSDLSNTVGLMKPDTKAVVGIYRERKKMSLTVKVAKWPENNFLTHSEGKDPKVENPFGLVVKLLADVEKSFLEQHEIVAKRGLVVVHLKKGSIAELSGLKVNDVITSVNSLSKYTNSIEEFNNLLNSLEDKSSLILGIQRGKLYNLIELKK